MKVIKIILIVLLITISVTAQVMVLFQGWDRLKETSPYIIVAHCGKPTLPTSGVIGGLKSDSEIQIITVLKGTNSVSSARLQTDHELWQGENYLVFAYYGGGIYQAYEKYRVIPLGLRFSTNSISGKPLDEQIQILFQQALYNLNQEIQNDQEEKQQLEEGIKK
jgi:hypothetical protein